MPNVQQEREHLAKAERDIVEGERRVAEQIILIKQMRQQGRDTTLAGEFLRNLELTLEQWNAHRRLILGALARG